MKKHIFATRKYLFPYTRIRPMFRLFYNNGCNNLVGCEVGIQKGVNLKSIVIYLPINKLYAVDIDLSMNRFYDSRIVFIEKDSLDTVKEISDRSLDFCYIDSGHTYKDTIEEIQAYLPKVKSGGVIGGHDFNNKGVSRAVFDCFSFDDIVDGEDWYVRKG